MQVFVNFALIGNSPFTFIIHAAKISHRKNPSAILVVWIVAGIVWTFERVDS